MDKSRERAGNALGSSDIDVYYERLKNICEGNDEKRKIQIAEKMAKRMDEDTIIYLLARLSEDINPCKLQVILTLSKIKTPNENMLKILGTLLDDYNYYIRVEASRIITNLADLGIPNLEKLAENLFNGRHESKARAIRIYEQIWKSYPEQVIQNLGKAVFQERDYIIFKDVIDLLGEIGREYPKEVTELFSDLLPNTETSEKQIILNAITKFAKDHPNEALQLLSQVGRSGDICSRLIPDILPLTVSMLPKRSLELLRKVATSDNRSVRLSVMKSLVHFEKTYPDETLAILFELWKKTSDDKPTFRGEECATQEDIRSRFTAIGVRQPIKALSFLQILSTSEDARKKGNALAATLELAPKIPDRVFPILEVFLHDEDYEIRKIAASSLSEDWNIFPEKTAILLEPVAKKEIESLQKEIKGLFSLIKRQDPSGAVVLLKKLENGDSKAIIDTIYKTTYKLCINKEKIPKEMLLDGISRIQRESIECLRQNQVETYEKGLAFLKEVSTDYAVWIRIIALRILSQFLPTNLDAVLEVLERLAEDEVPQVRLEALEYVVQLKQKYPNESFKIITKLHSNQNRNVRTDVVQRLFHFKIDFPVESFLLLKEHTDDLDPIVRTQVAQSIAEFTDSFPEECLRMISKLCVDNNDSVFRAAFVFLEKYAETNSEDVLSLVENLHTHSNPTIREKTASFLGTFKKEHSERAIKIIGNLLRDVIGSVRSSAFSSFDQISNYQPEKAQAILSTLVFEKNPEIRQKVIKSIGVLSQSNSFGDIEMLEPFLEDEDTSVKIELALTLGKMGRKNTRKAFEIFRKMLLLRESGLLREAIAEAMADFGRYCPYEAMKILFYLSKDSNEIVSRKTEESLHLLRDKLENFSYLIQNCFKDRFYTLKDKELVNIIEIVAKKTNYEDAYMKEMVYRYNLYHSLLRFSTTSRINTSESLLTEHFNNFQLVDGCLEKALPALRDIARLLEKQNFYAKRDDKIENLRECLELVEKTGRQFTKELKEFDNPDRYILQSVLKTWQNIISVEFIKLRGKAELKPTLESKKAMKRENTIVRLKLANEGISKAENIRVSILSSSDFTIVGPPDRTLKILSPNDFNKIEFSIKVKKENGPVRISFTITYDDAEKGGKILDFADQITFFKTEREYVEIINPYIVGIPLKTPEMFYGRDKFLGDIEVTLKMTDRTHILILHGQRRTGKTSIFYQLKLRLGDDFLPVILDFQGIPDSGTDNFFYWITREIWRELSGKNIEIAMPDESKFIQRPAFYFRDVFLQEVRQKLGNRKMILMMDEFEIIDDRIREGKIDRDILTFMRNLMQHSNGIDFIFSGTHQLEEMSSDYWSILFNIGLYHKISFLEKKEAVQLICDPVKKYMEYDPLAVEKILEMTAGHPYFVQLICYYLINHQKEKRRNYATIEDVNEVLDMVVVAGTPHFEYIWEGMNRMEQIVLLTLANVLSSQSVLTITDAVRYLQQYFFEIGEQRIREIFEKFLKDDIIEQKVADHYWFKVELIKRWCEKNKELYKIMEVGQDE